MIACTPSALNPALFTGQLKLCQTHFGWPLNDASVWNLKPHADMTKYNSESKGMEVFHWTLFAGEIQISFHVVIIIYWLKIHNANYPLNRI